MNEHTCNFIFLLLVICKSIKKNKQIRYNDKKRLPKQNYLTEVNHRCTRCGLYGNESIIKDAILSMLPTKQKMSQAIVNKYFSHKFAGNVQQYKKLQNDNECSNDLLNDLCLLMPDITAETKLSVDAIFTEKLDSSVMEINKIAVSALMKVDEIYQECYFTLCDKLKGCFEKSRNVLVVSILQQIEDSQENLYIKVLGCIKNHIVDTENVNVDFSAMFYFEMTKKKEEVYKEFVSILDQLFQNVKNKLANLTKTDQLDDLDALYTQKLVVLMFKADNNVKNAILEYFINFFNSWKDKLLHFLQHFSELKNLADNKEISEYLSLEFNSVKDEVNSIIQDGIVHVNDEVINIVDKVIDKTKHVVKSTVEEIIAEVEQNQTEIIKDSIKNADSELLSNVEILIAQYLETK